MRVNRIEDSAYRRPSNHLEPLPGHLNMTARELEKWLDTAESKSVGQKQGGDESKGHASGRHIVEILNAKRGDLTDADYAHMRKVVGYAKRHLAQRPHG